MITLALTLVVSVFALAGGYVFYVCSQADQIVFMSSSGKEYTIECSHWFGRNGPRAQIRSEPDSTDDTLDKPGH